MIVFIADKLSEEGLAVLRREPDLELVIRPGLSEDELAREVDGAVALLIRSGAQVTRRVIEAARELRVIGRAGVGVDNVDLEAATERGVVVMNTPNGNTIAAAEHTIGLILALARNIPQAQASFKAGRWERNKFIGRELNGKVLGVVGLGRIGSEVARVCQAFRMKVLASDPFIAEEQARALGIELLPLEELFSQADIISLHLPVTEETRGLVGEQLLRKMKPTALLVNCARGALIDEPALDRALREGVIAGAALDVFAKEPPEFRAIIENEKVVATPHLGASTHEAQINVGVQIAEQVVAALKRNVFDNAVNLPISDFSVLERFRPYIELTERIGNFSAQFVSGGLREVEVTVAGLGNEALQPLKLSLLKGLLTPVTGGNVNFVNAPYLAKQRGIRVNGTLTDNADYTTQVSCTVTTDRESCRVDGTVFGEELQRIVRINEFHMDVNPRGEILVLKNLDVPGVIGQVGATLGSAGINIAEYRLGREDTAKNTLSLVSVDSPVPDQVVEQLRAIHGMQLVKKVRI